LSGSLASEVVAVIKGANIIRTHNIRETLGIIRTVKKLSRLDKSL